MLLHNPPDWSFWIIGLALVLLCAANLREAYRYRGPRPEPEEDDDAEV